MNKATLGVAIVAVAGAAYVGANYYANQQVDLQVAKQVSNFEKDTGFQVSYADSSVDLFTSAVEINDITVTDPNNNSALFTVDKVHVVGYEPDKISPYTEFDLMGLKLSEQAAAMADSVSPELMQATYNINTSLSFDEQSGDSEFKFATTAGDILSTSMDVALGNSKALMTASLEASKMPAEQMTMEQELQLQTKMMQAMQSLELQSFHFTVNNQGKLAELLEGELAHQGMSKADFEAALEQQFNAMMLPEEIKTAFKDFAAGMQSLNVSITATEKQSVMALGQQLAMGMQSNPEMLSELLEIEASGK